MRDVVYEMEVTLEELCHGGVKKVRIWSEVPSEGGGGGRERVARDIEIGLTAGMSAVSVGCFVRHVFMTGKRTWRERRPPKKVCLVCYVLGVW